MTIKARAKINLALDVTGKRNDGYHDMRMVMQTLELYDEVTLEKKLQTGLTLRTNLSWLPTNEKNLVYKAVQLLMEQYGIQDGISVYLKKTIPVGAGLAGGSSDCAAALKGMRELFSLPMTDEELYATGATLGSDVPFCLMGGTALAWGRGEKLQPLTPHPSVYVVLAKPPVSVSTGAVFSKLRLDAIEARPDIDAMTASIERQEPSGIAAHFCNVLETVTEHDHPLITKLKESLLESGALGALMTGSGPTVFGYFLEEEQGLCAINRIKEKYPQVSELFLTKIYPYKGCT